MFQQALPVWARGSADEKNLFLRFTAQVRAHRAALRIACCCVYRLFVNGAFVCWGPARAAHGCSRVDEIELTRWLSRTGNRVEIEVGSYRVNSYEYPDEPGFLQAEIASGDTVLAATGRGGFTACEMTEKLRKVQRYSYQRTFCEAYRLPAEERPVELETRPPRRLLARSAPYCSFPVQEAGRPVLRGAAVRKSTVTLPQFDRYVSGVSTAFKGFRPEELEDFAALELAQIRFTPGAPSAGDARYRVGEYGIYDLSRNVTGLIGCEARVFEDTELWFLFDELLTDGDVDKNRLTCENAVKYLLRPGRYRLLSFEPYTMRYLKAVVLAGSCELQGVFVRRVENPVRTEPPASLPPALRPVYQAAVETFRQCAVDIYMDCPSRERAGWLCDSFFTARAEYALTGSARVEHDFLENYLLPKRFPGIPEGMVPMCYPAEHTDGVFIPNWAMWLILELPEYLARSGDRAMIAAFQSRVQAVLQYLSAFENEDGLLENLSGWIFIEWSKCNELTSGVNYPSNMLYAKALRSAASLYGDEHARQKADRVEQEIVRQSCSGLFFHEHALRTSHGLELAPDVTETCQYYAFFCGIAQPETFPELWDTLRREFGPDRVHAGAHSDVSPSNAFIGNLLRLDLLKTYGCTQQLRREIAGYYGRMARLTGTLWEHDVPTASCCHGFASYLVCLLDASGGANG